MRSKEELIADLKAQCRGNPFALQIVDYLVSKGVYPPSETALDDLQKDIQTVGNELLSIFNSGRQISEQLVAWLSVWPGTSLTVSGNIVDRSRAHYSL